MTDPTSLEVDPVALIELAGIATAEAESAWEVAGAEQAEDAAALWADLAVKIEGLAETYAQLAARYSTGTVAEA